MSRKIYFSLGGKGTVRGFMLNENGAPSSIQAMLKAVEYYQKCGKDSSLYEQNGFGRYFYRQFNGYYTCNEREVQLASEDSEYNIILEENYIRFICREYDMEDIEDGEAFPEAPSILYENWSFGDLVLDVNQIGELIEFCKNWDKPFIFKHEDKIYDLYY